MCIGEIDGGLWWTLNHAQVEDLNGVATGLLGRILIGLGASQNCFIKSAHDTINDWH